MKKNASSLSTKQFFYILVGITVLAVISIIAALYLGNASLSDANRNTALLLAERDVAREKLDKLSTIAAQAREADSYEQTVTSIIPKTKDQQTLVAEIIYTATSEAQISTQQITSFNFSGNSNGALNDLSGTTPLPSPAGVYEYPFSVSLTGISYSQLLKLFTEIESNQRLIQISTTNITPNSAAGGTLDVNLVMKAYVQP